MHPISKVRFGLAPIAAAILAISPYQSIAHTTSVGYTSAGAGSVNFWYGTYHSSVSATEGSLQLTGPNAFSTTVPFTLLVSTKPTGLVDGTNNFYSDGTQLVAGPAVNIQSWQGVTFTSLSAGTYTFTYIPIASPTSTWQPTDSIILSSSVTLDASILGASVYNSASSLRNSPALSAAQVIDANSNLQALFSSLSTDQEISSAASQTLPLLTGGSMAAAGNALSGINKVIQARIESNRGLSSGDGFFGDKYVWVKPFGSWADQDDQDGISGFKSTTTGVAFGVDSAVNDKLRLGTAMAYAKADVDSNSSVAKQSADVDVFQLVGYGSYSLGNNSEVNFQVDVGQNSNKGRRSIAFTNTTATSEYTSYTAHAGAGLGRTYQLSAATSITPSIRADYTWIKDKAYQESGAGLLNLNVGSRDSEELVLGLDGKISHQLSDNTSLSANLGVGYDTMAKRSSITATFAGAPGAAFTTYGLDAEPWSARAGVGLTHTTANGTEITLRYDAEHREAFLNQTASLKARWAF